MAKARKTPDMAEHERFMALALEEAKRGLGRTRPNPAVGALVVKDGKIIARGHHEKAGGPHAEVVALRAAGAKAKGADLYSTLEPCNHEGRTPPCTEAILKAGIRRVFVGCRDANPIVSGRGVRRLRAAGVEVTTSVLEGACAQVNRGFFTYITERRPYVTLKIASTADGKIATATGDSKWVTSEAARERVHQLRDQVDAVLVGAGTVRADDPQLTARPGGKQSKRQPLRVIVSGSLDLPVDARMFTDGAGPVVVYTAEGDHRKAVALEARGVEVVRIKGRKGRVDMKDVLADLTGRHVLHVLVEGGAEIYGEFLAHGPVDEVLLFVAPKILGDGVSWARLGPKRRMAEALQVENMSVERVGDDLLLVGHPARP